MIASFVDFKFLKLSNPATCIFLVYFGELSNTFPAGNVLLYVDNLFPKSCTSKCLSSSCLKRIRSATFVPLNDLFPNNMAVLCQKNNNQKGLKASSKLLTCYVFKNNVLFCADQKGGY